MARFFSTFGKIKGKIGNLSFYVLERIPVVKTKSGPTKEMVKNKPSFATTRCNNNEFGGASRAAKALRISLGYTVKQFQDHAMNGRLAGRFRTIVQHSPGIFGFREVNLVNNAQLLHNFQMCETKPLSKVMQAPLEITASQDRVTTSLFFPQLSKELLKCAKGATHFKLIAVAAPIANYLWDTQAKTYRPALQTIKVPQCIQETPWLSCNETHQNVEIQLALAIAQPLPIEMVNFIWLGIQFGQEINSQILPLKGNSAMASITHI